jgi:hypothetical protein
MNLKQLKSLAVQISDAKHHLELLESQYSALRLEALRQVTVVKNAASITLVFNGRRINAKPVRDNRYLVKESGKVLAREYFGGIHDLRFEIAVGAI